MARTTPLETDSVTRKTSLPPTQKGRRTHKNGLDRAAVQAIVLITAIRIDLTVVEHKIAA